MAPTLVTACTALPPEGAAAPAVWQSQPRGPGLQREPSPASSLRLTGYPELDEGPEVSEDAAADTALLDERALSKLKWRCRRGLLENDLLIQRFFARHEAALTVNQAMGLNGLMDLSDNDLLDLLLKRKEPDQLPEAESQASASTPEALEVLNLLRPASGSARLLSPV
jgi:antitoxin CptB